MLNGLKVTKENMTLIFLKTVCFHAICFVCECVCVWEEDNVLGDLWMLEESQRQDPGP